MALRIALFWFYLLVAQTAVDKVLSSESAWTLHYQDQADVDDYRVPECAEKFLMMIQSITGKLYARLSCNVADQ